MSAGDVRDYDPNQIVTSWGPVKIQDGLADGVFVSVEYLEDNYTTKVGADGSVTRTKNNSKLVEITVSLMQTSPINQQISAVLDAATLAGTGADILPFLVKDLVGTTLIGSSKCWVKKKPKVDFGKDSTTRDWVFQGVADGYFVGGN